MQQPVSVSKTAIEMLWVQLTWTFWFVGIILVINVFNIFFSSDGIDGFYSSGYISSNIYMLVIGIITISFLRYYVENGVTRKNYYYGNILAAIGISIILPILIYLISLVEKFIFNSFTSIVLQERTLGKIDIDMDGNIIGEIVQTMILTPFISPENNLLFSLALFSLHIFVFYLIGWLIGSGFSRLGVIGGLAIIVLGIAFLMIKDTMVRVAFDFPLLETFSVLNDVPESMAYLVIAAIILVTLLLIRLLTKRAPIKI